MWDKIREEMNSHAYMSRIERDKQRIQSTAEHFTPTDLVLEMIEKTGVERFGAGKTVLDPACGDGQFLMAVKCVKVYMHQMSEQEALQDIYGVDIMRDNVDLCTKRLGGGTILMGDSLNPDNRLDDQTDDEYYQLRRLFSSVDIEQFCN